MVLNCAELESDLFWRWFSRPQQTDGMTVKDYYTQFGDWMQELISLSFPANEDDYIDEFIANLSWDIRCRLYKYDSRRSRLSTAYQDARFEESMMIIEENLKQIRANKVFDKMSHPENGENDELQEAEVIGDDNSDELLVQFEEVSENDVSPFTNVSIDDESVVDYELNSHTGAPFIRFPGLVFTGLKSFPAKFVMVKDAYQVFDKTPQLTFAWSFKEIVGAESYVPLIDGIPQVFDPETLIINGDLGAAVMLYMPWPSFCIHNVLIPPSVIETASSKSSIGKFCSISIVEKVGMFSLNAGAQLTDTSKELFLSKEGLKSCEYSAMCLPNDWGYEASVMTSLELDVYFCVDAMLTIIFDPGGTFFCYMCCYSFRPIGEQNFVLCDFWADELTSAEVRLCWTDPYLRNENNLVYSTLREFKNVIYLTNHDAMFLYEPGESCYFSRHWKWNGDFEFGVEEQGHNMMRENGKYVVFSFDPGGYFSHNREGLYEAIKLSFGMFLCYVSVYEDCFHKAGRHELHMHFALGKMAYTAQESAHYHLGDIDSINLAYFESHEYFLVNASCTKALKNWFEKQSEMGPHRSVAEEVKSISLGDTLNEFSHVLVRENSRVPEFKMMHSIFGTSERQCIKVLGETFSTLLVLLHRAGLTWEENESQRSINLWIGMISRLYEHSAIGFCEKQHNQSVMKQSGIDNAEVEQPSQVDHLSYINVGIHEFGCLLGKLQLQCKLHAWSVFHFVLIAEFNAHPSLILTPGLPSSRNSLTTQVIRAINDKTWDIGLISWKKQRVVTLVFLEALGTRGMQMFSGSYHFHEGNFTSGHKNIVLLMVIILESFVWDPGLGAQFLFPLSCSVGAFLVDILFLYILGDNDDFAGERRGWYGKKIEDEMRQKMRYGKLCQMVVYFRLARDHAKIYAERLDEVYVGDIDGVSHRAIDDIDVIRSTPCTPTVFSLHMEHYIWDPGSFISVLLAFWKDSGVNSHFTTLRTSDADMSRNLVVIEQILESIISKKESVESFLNQLIGVKSDGAKKDEAEALSLKMESDTPYKPEPEHEAAGSGNEEEVEEEDDRAKPKEENKGKGKGKAKGGNKNNKGKGNNKSKGKGKGGRRR